MKVHIEYTEDQLYGWTKITVRSNGMIEFLAEEWCETNLKQSTWAKPYGSFTNVFMFRKREDATWFALRWL